MIHIHQRSPAQSSAVILKALNPSTPASRERVAGYRGRGAHAWCGARARRLRGQELVEVLPPSPSLLRLR